MHGPLDDYLGPQQASPELVVLTTDRETGNVTGAVALGAYDWDHILCELVVDAGRLAQMDQDAAR